VTPSHWWSVAYFDCAKRILFCGIGASDLQRAEACALIHDLRHTFASLLVSGGASMEVIGRLLGHTQIGTTQRYAHLIDWP